MLLIRVLGVASLQEEDAALIGSQEVTDGDRVALEKHTVDRDRLFGIEWIGKAAADHAVGGWHFEGHFVRSFGLDRPGGGNRSVVRNGEAGLQEDDLAAGGAKEGPGGSIIAEAQQRRRLIGKPTPIHGGFGTVSRIDPTAIGREGDHAVGPNVGERVPTV
jgi:hypothetical protein